MLKKLQLKSWFLLLAVLLGGGSAWAEETLVYTLDGSITTGGNSNYAQDGGGLTQNGMEWSVTANTTINPWRVGGKNLSNEDREVYSKTAMGSSITKVELEVGSITLSSVNSIKLIVASDNTFESEIQTITKSDITANTTLTFTPSESEWATGAYYKFVFNVSAGGSNSYIQLKSAKFYKDDDTPTISDCDLALTPITLNFDLYNNSDAQVINYTTSSTGDVTIENNDYASFSINKTAKTITVTPTAVTPSAQTITVNQAADDNYKAGSATFTFTITDSTPYTVTLGDDNTTLTEETAGAGVTLPSRDDNGDYTFVGWSEENISVETTTVPTYFSAGEYKPTKDVTLYPVYTRTEQEGSGAEEWVEIFEAPTDGYYAICSADYFMKAEIESKRFKNGDTPNISDGKLTDAPASDCTWEIYKAADNNYRIKNGTNYAGATGSNNQGALLTDESANYAKWTISYSGGFVIENVDMASANKNKTLRNNGNYGWGTYGATTGSAPRLFMKQGGITTTTYYVSTPVADTREEAGISFAEAAVTVELVENYTGQALTNPNNVSPITWKSSNEAVATVDNGTVTVIAVGETTISAAFAGDENYKKATVSYTLTVQDSREDPGFSFSASTAEALLGETFDAPTFSNPNNVAVTFESTEPTVATIAQDGTVTILAAGTTTIKATSEANNTYLAGEASYTLTVTDPNAPGTENNPYTVAEAIAFINTLGSNTSEEDVYVSGIISQVDSYNSTYKSITYWISDDGQTTSQMEVYSGKGLNGADFSSKNDLAVGDIVTVKGKVKMYGETPEFDKNNQLVSFVHVEKPSINAENIELAYDATSGEIAYTISNSVDGQSLTATTTAEWISNITVAADKVTFTTTANEGSTDRFATITLSYEGASDKEVTVKQLHLVIDYATLPFIWEGGTSSELEAVDGVTTEGVGSDYAITHDPYRVKFDSDGDYIQVKTNDQILNLFVAVKMIGGANTSTITVQGSADGENFADVQVLTISGKQNNILNLETSEAFAATDRYVRLLFTRGSNVGIGAIAINAVKKSISDAGYATYCSGSALDFTDSGLTAYIATMDGNTVKFAPVTTTVPANTGLLLKGTEGEYFINVVAEGAADVSSNKLEGVLTATDVGEGAFVLLNGDQGVGFYKTSSAGFTVGAYTAYLPAFADSRSFIGFDFDNTTTGVNGITAETMANGAVYNLQGQRISESVIRNSELKSGLYIVNGKKVLVK